MRGFKAFAVFVGVVAAVVYALRAIALLTFAGVVIALTAFAFWNPDFFRTRAAVDFILAGWFVTVVAAVLQGVLAGLIFRR